MISSVFRSKDHLARTVCFPFLKGISICKITIGGRNQMKEEYVSGKPKQCTELNAGGNNLKIHATPSLPESFSTFSLCNLLPVYHLQVSIKIFFFSRFYSFCCSNTWVYTIPTDAFKFMNLSSQRTFSTFRIPTAFAKNLAPFSVGSFILCLFLCEPKNNIFLKFFIFDCEIFSLCKSFFACVWT